MNRKKGCMSAIIFIILYAVVYCFINNGIRSKTTLGDFIPIKTDAENEYSYVHTVNLYALNKEGMDYIVADLLFGSKSDDHPVAFKDMYEVKVLENGVERSLIDVDEKYGTPMSNSSGPADYQSVSGNEHVKLFHMLLAFDVNDINADFTIKVYDRLTGREVISKNVKALTQKYEK